MGKQVVVNGDASGGRIVKQKDKVLNAWRIARSKWNEGEGKKGKVKKGCGEYSLMSSIESS